MGPSLRIWNIQITGQETISDISLHHLSNIHFGSHVLSVDPKHAEEELLRHPWIRSAEVEIEYPSTVKIQVEEHKPILLLALEKMWYLSDRGIPFRQADSSNIDYPILTGIPNSWVDKHPHIVKKIIEHEERRVWSKICPTDVAHPSAPTTYELRHEGLADRQKHLC